MKILATFLIVLFSLTTQAQTKPKQPKRNKDVYAKVVSFELKDSTMYKVTTDKGIIYYTSTKPKIGATIKFSNYKK